MKRIILFFAVLAMLSSCENRDPDVSFRRWFVSSYMDGTWEAIDIFHLGEDMKLVIPNPQFYVDNPHFPEMSQKFLEIAIQNGDVDYNREEGIFEWTSRGACFADNFKAVRLVCTNAAWDAEHPQGTLLNDVTQIRYYTYAPYVRSRYTSEKDKHGTLGIKYLSELKEDDLAMIYSELLFYFDTHPSPGSYQMQITLVTTEDQEKIVNYTLEIK